jgi:hypothetical protein
MRIVRFTDSDHEDFATAMINAVAAVDTMLKYNGREWTHHARKWYIQLYGLMMTHGNALRPKRFDIKKSSFWLSESHNDQRVLILERNPNLFTAIFGPTGAGIFDDPLTELPSKEVMRSLMESVGATYVPQINNAATRIVLMNNFALMMQTIGYQDLALEAMEMLTPSEQSIASLFTPKPEHFC